MESLVLQKAPPLDPAWLQYESEANLLAPRPVIGQLERQPIYAAQCRELDGSMMAPGAPYHHLSQGITRTELTVTGGDGWLIPVLKYELTEEPELADKPWYIIIYYHGGGLHVGEADSEDLQCRRILKESGLQNITLYSVGYRLKPKYTASLAVADCMDAFNWIVDSNGQLRERWGPRYLIVGSSSGGELAALVSQAAPKGSIHGLVLRCPVTSDAFKGPEYVPEKLRPLHTSAWDMSFSTSLLTVMTREIPRDGLERMPLEAPEEQLQGLPRTWIQVCSNDMLYSDGLCYAKALQDAGVDVKLEVVKGWPHTFWLKAPQLPQALAADKAMLKGLAWVAGEDESIVL